MSQEATSSYTVRPIERGDSDLIRVLLVRHWGSAQMVSRGRTVDMSTLPGFIAEDEGGIVGLVTYHREEVDTEVVSLDAFRPGVGIGSKLLRTLESVVKSQGVRRVWIVTSNDNIGALTFYQKVGYRIVAVHPFAIDEARKIKPQIPLVAENGIPIRDELELEKIIS